MPRKAAVAARCLVRTRASHKLWDAMQQDDSAVEAMDEEEQQVSSLSPAADGPLEAAPAAVPATPKVRFAEAEPPSFRRSGRSIVGFGGMGE